MLFEILLLAQERGSVFFTERERDYRFFAGMGYPTKPVFSVLSDYYSEPLGRSYFHATFSYGGVFSKGRSVAHLEFMSRFQNKYGNWTFDKLNCFDEFMGYDRYAISLLNFVSNLTGGYVFPYRWYFGLRYPLKWVERLAFGRFYINLSPYTVYRTWGLEGLLVQGSADSRRFDYLAFASYQPVENPNNSTDVHWRELLILNFRVSPSSLFGFRNTGVFYEVPAIRFDRVVESSFWVLPLDYAKISLLSSFKEHAELSGTSPAFYSGRRWNIAFYMRLPLFGEMVSFSFKHQETSPDFFPYDSQTWLPYPPYYMAETWNYEDVREIRSNEVVDMYRLAFSALGLDWKLGFEDSSPADEEAYMSRDWEKLCPPGRVFHGEVYYTTPNWSTLSVELWRKEADSPSIGPFVQDVYRFSAYIPLGARNNLNLVSLLSNKRVLNTGKNYMFYAFSVLFKYWLTQSLFVSLETKVSSSSAEPPSWLLASPYWWEQSWGLLNFWRLRVKWVF